MDLFVANDTVQNFLYANRGSGKFEEIGLPADVYFRFHVSRLYFDILGGLAILFGNAQPFRAHAGVGMGVFIAKGFGIGFEGGYLMNSANVLLRLQFNF